MLVQRPGRKRDDIALLPREAATVDDRLPDALDDVIDGAARLAMGLEPLTGTEHLNPAGHCREQRSTGLRMRVLEGDAVVLIAVGVAQGFERLPRLLP